jgi:hypothetical protein
MAIKSGVLDRIGWPSKKQQLEGEPHKESFVWWTEVRRRHVRAFEKCLLNAKREQDVHAFLEMNPITLIQHLGGGHGRWVISKQRLGCEHVTDFIIGERDSSGYEWHAVELESPNVMMFTKAGKPSARLNDAILQILDWRSWLKNNQRYAAAPATENGLDLRQISPNLKALIVIGRRKENEKAAKRRRQLQENLNIQIHSYDFLLDNARRAAFFYARGASPKSLPTFRANSVH